MAMVLVRDEYQLTFWFTVVKLDFSNLLQSYISQGCVRIRMEDRVPRKPKPTCVFMNIAKQAADTFISSMSSPFGLQIELSVHC
jgi:hypothetical protein